MKSIMREYYVYRYINTPTPPPPPVLVELLHVFGKFIYFTEGSGIYWPKYGTNICQFKIHLKKKINKKNDEKTTE